MVKEVYIDGVKYVPYKEVIIDKDKMINTLLKVYWGWDTDIDESKILRSTDFRIEVGDWMSEDGGVSVQEFIEQLAKG